MTRLNKLMKELALDASDVRASYCSRLYDNYFWRFCILFHLLRLWEELRLAIEQDRVASWFADHPVEELTARQAWRLCEYYYLNTAPFLEQISEPLRMDSERKVIRLIQQDSNERVKHSRLLCKSRMDSREFRAVIESLIEKQGIIAHENRIYNNRVQMEYQLNPVLRNVKIG